MIQIHTKWIKFAVQYKLRRSNYSKKSTNIATTTTFPIYLHREDYKLKWKQFFSTEKLIQN